MKNLILASQSLGRRELLEYLRVSFKVIATDLDEEKIVAENPLETLKLRARLKAESAAGKTSSSFGTYLILSADSGAILDGKLIGKPKNKKEAVQILQTLSGRTHEFVTAVYILVLDQNRLDNRGSLSKTSSSRVTFRKLTTEDINTYLAVTDFTRFAGSYALISAQNFITKIEGSLSNVIGLPLELIIPIFRTYNFL